MVQNDFEQKKKSQDFNIIKRNLGHLLINYRSIRINYKKFSINCRFFLISNLVSAPLFLHKVSYHIILRCEFHGHIIRKKLTKVI